MTHIKFWESLQLLLQMISKRPTASLRKKCIPMNPGNPEAEEKFKEVAGAYDLRGFLVGNSPLSTC